MPEYVNKDYYRQLAPDDRSFLNLSAQNIRTVMDRLNAENILFSATVGYKNTITVSKADRERALAIVNSLSDQNRSTARIIGNVPYKELPPSERKYINTDTETALQVANIIAGDSSMKFSGRISGNSATLTVVGEKNAATVRRIIDNIQNMDLVNELREKGYERIADTNGFVNIRNMQTGETAGFESLREARNMFLDPDNEFFHPTAIRIEENSFFRIVSDEENMDYYISEYDPENGEERSVYLDDEGRCPTFSSVNEALEYAAAHSIDYTNTENQLEHWRADDEERAADRERYENNIIIQTKFPHVDNRYPNDILYNPDSKAFSWVYFNEQGDGGDGEFIDITVTEDDVLAAYNSENFLEYIYQNCKQNIIDTHSGYFEDYANAYINPNNDVVRRYQELTIQAYLEEHTPAVQKAKKSLEGEISADSDSLIIDGYESTWYVVDTEAVDGKELFLLENEEYGDETFGIIIDKDRNVLVDEAWNGFADYHEKYDNLTPEEKLANKVTAEWKAFLEGMKKESPAVLIESAYEISTKDNIQTYITEENLNLTEKQINALLSSKNTLDDFYDDWTSDEYLNSYSDVAELLTLTADKINEAIDRENLMLFKKENLACAHDIDAFLSKHYNNNSLDSNAALTELLERYLLERIQVVVAANLYKKDFDGRISKENYNWGNEIIGKLSENMRMGINANYLTTHPGLLNLFANTVREYEAKSIEKEQEQPAAERTAEDITIGDRYRYNGADVEVVSMKGVYPDDVGISKTERMGNREYSETSNVDKYELHINGQYLGDGEKTVVSELDMAKKYIEDFLNSEFSSTADFSDMKHIAIGYTEIGSEKQGDHSLQMEADLENFSVSYFIDEELAKTEKYDSLEQMNHDHLSLLSFEDMLHVGTTELDRILEEKSAVVSIVLAVSQNDTNRYYIANDVTEEAVKNVIANSDKLFMDLCALGGIQVTEAEFAKYSQTEGVTAIDVNIDEQTMHVYGADKPITSFAEIKGIDEIAAYLDLANNTINFSVITIEGEKPFVTGSYVGKDDITALEEYQEYIADTGKQFADVTVEFYQIGGDNESVSADDRECAYILEHLQEVMSHNDALCLESDIYSVSTPRELFEADEPEPEEVQELESDIIWIPIPESADDNGNPTSYSTKYRGEIFFISENGDGKYDVEFENMRHHGQMYYAPINEEFSGFLSRADAEEYFADNIDEYIAVRDEKILDSIVANITEPTPEEREELAKKSNTLNRFFNNNPKTVFREIVDSAGLTPTEDITVGDTKEIFNALKSVDISFMGYTYTLEFEPHDDGLTVKDTASNREADFVWGHARELMYLIANENNISRDNLIHNEVMRGTGFEDGKFRVEEFYKNNPTKNDFVKFLKNEYGIGGHSGERPVRFAVHDSKGIEITTTSGKETYTWAEVAKVISNLIDNDKYITQNDIDRRIYYAKVVIDNANENTDFTRLIHAHEVLQKYGIEKPEPDNEYKIYQLKKGPENHAIRFEGFTNAERYGEAAKPENYDLIYTGSLDDFEDSNKLEAIYTKFNLDRPEDFKGHSLSVSDIIVMNNEAHYVDSYGFVDVSDRFLGKEKEKINVNDYENIRLVRRTEWNDKNLSDAENPAFEEITESYTPDEDGSFTKYAYNKTNSIHVDVWEEENSVSSEDMLADISKHLENMRKGVSSRDYHIELTDRDGNVRTLDNNFFNFVIEESKVIAETMDFPEIPIDEMGAAIDAENSRTDYGYEPAIGDLLEKDDELFRISDISDNIITIEETSSLFHESENMTLADFINRGYALVKKAEPAEKVKSPVDTRESVQSDEDKSPLDTYKNNYVITDENLGVNGPKARFNANIAAVETLKTIEAEGRTATPEEQKILSGYTGWGAIPQAFDPRNDDWKNEYEKLKSVLDDAEYSEARRSTLNSHYTSPVVINAIYEGLANIGFEKGKILEPAMGIGNFFGVMPENMRGSELHGVELDDLTGRIAKQLYPTADIQIKGFEKIAYENNSFDVVVANVPFGNYKVNNKDYNKNNFLIHDYFIAKSLDKVHPGGVVAVITSKGTMDKENDNIRKYIAQRAELLGAIRLPDTAFKANAGTEVVSDILFLQKRERPIEIDPDKEGWVKLGVSADGFDVNNYFAEHPEMVIGDFKEVSGRFGNEVTVKLDDSSMLKSLLFEAVQNIKGEYKAAEKSKVNEVSSDVIPAPAESRKFSFQAVNGELYYREAGDTMEKVPVKGKGKDKMARTVAMVELRDTVRELLDLQMNNSDRSLNEAITESRAKLNKVYDAFVAKYGFVSDKKNKDAFKGDDDYQLLSALENEDKEHNTYTKADIFEHNTVKPKTIAEHVETAQEALIISVAEKAKVDFDFMSELCGMDKDRMIDDLRGQIFRLPQEEEKYVTADEYLTGNIRKKISELENAPEDMDISENRAALEKAIPTRVEAKDISVKLGSHWIDPEYIRQFICEKFNPDWNGRRAMTVQYSKAAGEWKIEDVNAASKKNYTATNVFGTHRMHAYKILEGILNNSDLQVKDHKKDENGYDLRDEKGNYILVVNQEETKAVRQVANLIKSEFQDWIFKDPERREKLVQTYNEMYNSIRPREYDGSHLNFVGMNTDITLKEHQKNAIARALYGGNTLLAHAVGAGKTFEMIAIAMEGKRLGLHTKSLFAVPNSLTEQMGNDFRRLYPNSNILVATKKDFEKANRLKLFAKIAANDWDAVIVGHTQFDRMGLSPEREQEYIKAELEKLREELEYAAEYGEKSFSVKKIENAIASYQDRLNKLNDAQVKDDFIDFEKLGFDKLFIDECHMYKNLATATKMHNVSGLGSGGAARSFNLLMKSKYMDEITGGKGQTYASGTPISNSMSELYTMMRYLQADMLKDCGINHFDEWAADFGEVKTDYELKPESDGKYQLKTRFAKFTNLPELMGMFKECADIRTADTLNLEKPDAHFHEIVAEPSRTQKKLIKSLSKRATAIRDGKIDPREDNMLVITNDGRKIGLDQRLINPILEDEDGSKVNLCVNNVFDIYSRTADKRSTQCIFCDMSTPKSDSRQDRFEVYRPNSSKELGYELLRKKIGLGNGDEDNPKNINTFADVKSYIDKHSPEQSDKLSEGDIVVIRKPNMDDGKIYSQAATFEDGKLNDVNSVELLEKLLMSDVEDIPPKEFNVYDDIKGKLMDRGVPENEIAFIHDYETAEQKQKLFDKMNAGEVRILLGSTQKCGAGMNAQAKMIALHHLDCPLRPSDMEQRNGRIERQGNENPEVDIFRYVTNKSFDSYLFQILENKQKFISQVMTSKTPERTCADMDETALNYAEVKALCAGNPLIKREMELQALIKDLKMEKSRYSEHIYELQDNIRIKIPEKLRTNELVIQHLQKDFDTASNTPKFVGEDGKKTYPITLMGDVYNDRKEAGTKLKSLISANAARIAEGKMFEVGEYRGLKLSIFFDALSKHVKACLDGEKHHYCDLNPETDVGNIIRLDNCINNIQKSIEDLKSSNETMRSELKQMEADVDKPFSKAEELLKAETEIEEVHLQLTKFEMTDDTLQKEVFERIADMFPQVLEGDSEYVKFNVHGGEELHVEMNGDVLTICQTYEQNGDLMYDPRIDLKVDYDNKKVIPLSFENSGMGVYEEYSSELTPEIAKQMNDVLDFMDNTMLENIEAAGYEPEENNFVNYERKDR